MDVGGWLRGPGLGQYEANFRDNKIDADLLPQLTDAGLKDIGISALGDRLRRHCHANGERLSLVVRLLMTISLSRHQFPPEIIRHAVWLYLRFTLSYRDVEDLLAERGLDVSYETVRRWVLKFGPLFARELSDRRPRPTSRWHVDEMAVIIADKQFWLWRAIDDEGKVLDLLVQRRRDKRAAVKPMRKLLKRQGFAPTLLVTDKLRSYGAARSELGLERPAFGSTHILRF
jgi:transposase-like protein